MSAQVTSQPNGVKEFVKSLRATAGHITLETVNGKEQVLCSLPDIELEQPAGGGTLAVSGDSYLLDASTNSAKLLVSVRFGSQAVHLVFNARDPQTRLAVERIRQAGIHVVFKNAKMLILGEFIKELSLPTGRMACADTWAWLRDSVNVAAVLPLVLNMRAPLFEGVERHSMHPMVSAQMRKEVEKSLGM